MPWRTLCGFPPTAEPIILRLPFKNWRPDTVITDSEGNEMFVLLDQTQEMRSYEAIFGDLDGRRLCCVKRHLQPQFWKDGYYLCTYEPNYKGQRALTDRDVDNKRVYPFSYLQVNPMKGRFYYRMFDNQEGLGPPRFKGENPWLGYLIVCATPLVRTGRYSIKFKRVERNVTAINVDQWRNRAMVGPGVDLLAAMCIAYIFDRYQCQPLITVFGRDPEDELEQIDDCASINTEEQEEEQKSKAQQQKKPYTDKGFDIDEDDEDDNDNRGNLKNYQIDEDEEEEEESEDDDDDYNKRPIAGAPAKKNTIPNDKKRQNIIKLPKPNQRKVVLIDDEKAPDWLDTKNNDVSSVEPDNNDPYDTNWLDGGRNNKRSTTHNGAAHQQEDPYSEGWLNDGTQQQQQTMPTQQYNNNNQGINYNPNLLDDERAPSFVTQEQQPIRQNPFADPNLISDID